MNEFFNSIGRFLRNFQFWVIISPWEQGLRVRLGRYVSLLKAGVHLKLPFADIIFIKSVRLRISAFGRQTVTTTDGKVITFSGAVGYAIADIERLYRSLHHAEDTIQSFARARIAQYISTHTAAECHPSDIEQHLGASLRESLQEFGISEANIYINDFATVRTYRLIGDYAPGGMGSILSTDRTSAVAPSQG